MHRYFLAFRACPPARLATVPESSPWWEKTLLRAHALSARRKLLLVGPPGSGKTMTAAAPTGTAVWWEVWVIVHGDRQRSLHRARGAGGETGPARTYRRNRVAPLNAPETSAQSRPHGVRRV